MPTAWSTAAKALVSAYNGTVDALSSAVRDQPGASGAAPAKGAFYGDGLYRTCWRG